MFGDFGKPPPPTNRSRKKTATPDPAVVKANALCSTWWNALTIKPAGDRAFANVAALVAEDVRVGRPDDHIARALRECGVRVTRNALNHCYQQIDRPPQGRAAAAGGGIVQRNSTDWSNRTSFWDDEGETPR